MKFKTRLASVLTAISILLTSFSSSQFLSTSAENEKTEEIDNALNMSSVQTNSEAIIIDKEETQLAKFVYQIFGDRAIKNCENMYNLDGSADYIFVQFDPIGYVVFSAETMEMMEYNLCSNGPYEVEEAAKYYAGPTNYFYKSGNSFLNAVSGEVFALTDEEIISRSEQIRLNTTSGNTQVYSVNLPETYNIEDANIESERLFTSSSVPIFDKENIIVPSKEEGVWMKNSWYFLSDPLYGENESDATYADGKTGTCGPVAAQMIFNYTNYFYDRRIIPDRFLNGYNDETNEVENPELNPNHCVNPMSISSEILGSRSEGVGENDLYHDLIMKIMGTNTQGSSLEQVVSGMNTYLSDKIPASNYTLNSQVIAPFNSFIFNHLSARSMIGFGCPVILTLSAEALGEDAGHYVVAYGYQDYTYPNGGGTYKGYISNFCWKNSPTTSCVWTNAAWVKSYITFNAQHSHNYQSFNLVGDTETREYICSICGHRTDEVLNIFTADRYIERQMLLTSINPIKEYKLTFPLDGNWIIQTFGFRDTVMSIYDESGNLLISDNNSGYRNNALLSYNFTANTQYTLRIELAPNGVQGYVMLGMAPGTMVGTEYEDFELCDEIPKTYLLTVPIGNTQFVVFNPTQSGNFTIKASSCGQEQVDTYLYIVNPGDHYSWSLKDDDSGGDYNAMIQANLGSYKNYLIIITTYNINTQGGEVMLEITGV